MYGIPSIVPSDYRIRPWGMGKSEEENMSGSETTHSGLTRRNFLKATGAAVGAVAAAGCGTTLTGCASHSSGVEGAYNAEEIVLPGVCRSNCQQGCFLNVHVRDGKIVRTSARDMPDNRYKRVCAKGLSHVYRTYSEKRVKYPMKRVGERGKMESFERISWDQALDEICAKWKEITDEYGPGAMCMYWGSGQFGMSASCRDCGNWNKLVNTLGMSRMEHSCDKAAEVGQRIGIFGNDQPDIMNAKTIVVWGNDVAVSAVHRTHWLLEAQRAGAKLVVVDPTYKTMPSKADLWVPVRAGTDSVLAMAVIRSLMENDWDDKEFLAKNTSAPWLVKKSTGKYLRSSDLPGGAVSSGPDIDLNSMTLFERQQAMAAMDPDELDPAQVMMADGTVVSNREVDNPVLEGTFTVNGEEVTTAYSLLKEAVDEFTIERASEITGVDPDVIMELVDVWREGPITMYSSMGMNHYYNAHHAYFATTLLPVLTGNLGKPGAGYASMAGAVLGDMSVSRPEGTPGAPSFQVTTLMVDDIIETGKMGNVDAVIKGVIVCSKSPVTSGLEINHVKDWMSKMDIVVNIDVCFNDNTFYADYILPAAYWFEVDDMVTGGYFNHPYVMYNAKAIEPLYESVSDFNMANMFAEKMGVGEHFQITEEDYMRAYLDAPQVQAMGLTFDKLKEDNLFDVIHQPGHEDEVIINHEGQVFTKKLQIYFEDFTPIGGYDWGQEIDKQFESLPRFVEPNEVKWDVKNRKYPFQLFSEHTRYLTHSQWWEAGPLAELAGNEPVLKINPEDAAEYGIENGDLVRVFNDRGYVVLHAFINAGYPRYMLGVPKGWDQSQHIDGHISSLTSQVFDPVCVNSCFNDAVVDIEKIEEA